MADNKKTYSIVINGVKETTDAVKSLNDALTQLDEKIDGLQNEHINIAADVSMNTASTSTDMATVDNGGLDEKSRLLKEIEATQKRINELQGEEYVEILKQKSALKDVNAESVKAVDSLNDALGMLEEKLKRLEQVNISVSNTNNVSPSTTTRASSSRASSLQEEDKLLKQIQSTEQQIRDARREDYQQLLAQKDILKDITNEQKERAAAERLAANNYGSTMQGMKQQLADIKAVMQTTDIESDKFKELTKTANDLNSKLKEVEAAYGQFGRNVGNYGGVGMGEEFQKLTIEVNGVTREFNNAREALRTLTNERNTLKLMGEDVGELDNVVKTLRSDINDMERSSAVMDGLLDGMQGIIAIASTAEGLGALFGIDDSAIQQSIQKLVALQNILQGIEVIKKQMQTGEGIGGIIAKGNAAIDKFAASLLGVNKNANAASTSLKTTAVATTTVGTASKAATVAVRALSFALKTLGIGLVITSIAYLVQALENWLTKESEVEKAQKRLAEVNAQGAKAYANASAEIKSYQNRLSSFNGTKKQEQALVDELNNKYGKALGNYKSLDKWNKILTESGEVYCQSLLKEAEAQALLNLYTEAYISLQKVRDNVASGEYHHWWQTAAGDAAADAAEIKKAEEEVENAMNDYMAKMREVQNFNKNNKLFDYSNYADTKDSIKKGGTSVSKTVKDIENEIAKTRVDAMKAGLTKTLAQLELERSKRIEEAKKTGKLVQEQISSINKLYNQKILEARVTYHKQMLAEEKKFQDDMKKVQDETMQREYENSFNKNELKKVNRLENSIDRTNTFEFNVLTVDYNSSDIAEFFKEYDKDVVKSYTNTRNFIELTKKYLGVIENSYNTLDMPNGMKRTAELAKAKAEKELEAAEQQLEEIKREYQGIDTFVDQAARVVSVKMEEAYALRYQYRQEYYKKILDAEVQYSNREILLEKERIDVELKQLRDAENERHEILSSRIYNDDISEDDKKRYQTPRNTLSAYTQAFNGEELVGMNTNQIGKYFSDYNRVFNEWLDNLKKGYEEGKVSAEEYFSIVESTALKSYIKQKDEYENYLSQYNAMTAEGQAKNKAAMDSWTQAMNNAFVNYLDKLRNEAEVHQNALNTIEIQGGIKIEQSNKEHLDKMRNASREYNASMIQEYENVLSSISSNVDKAERRNALGIINYGATKRALDDLSKTTDQVLRDIANQKNLLVEQLKKGEITFGDFDTLMSQLKSLETQATDTAYNVKNKSKNLLTDFASSISQIVSQIGGSLNGVIGAIGDNIDQAFENQIRDLEEQINEYEELLDKQKEITQQHASEVDSIEEELKNARGSRREALIDRLNSEMMKQRESFAEEKKIEKEKERIEKEKDKKEKDRLEAQKKIQTTQAIIAGAVAFMNALSTSPIWVGIAMAAMTAAMTAVQISTIQSQKYAKGGVIEGKSHAQGGVKVLGGRAEVEGGEYITNKTTTEKNVDLLEYINSKRRKVNLDDMLEFYTSGKSIKKNINVARTKFADGGQIPQLRSDIDINDRLLTAFEEYSNRPNYVAVVDIMDRMDNVNEIRAIAGLETD